MKNLIFSISLSLAVLFLFVGSLAFAQNKATNKPLQTENKIEQMSNQKLEMQSYLIKFSHTPETCMAALDKISADSPEILNNIDWGCKSGDHTGYMIVNSKNEVDALQMIPASLRMEAKVEQLNKFSTADIKALHQKH